jgi:hypothetical protein
MRTREYRCDLLNIIWSKFVSDLRQVCGYLWVLPYPPQKYTDYQDITEILLKVVMQKKINNANNLNSVEAEVEVVSRKSDDMLIYAS